MHRDNNALVNIKRWHRCIEIHDPIVSKEVPSHVPLVSELLYLLQANPVCTLAKMLMTQLMTTAHMSENGVPPNSKGFFMFPILYQMATSINVHVKCQDQQCFNVWKAHESTTNLWLLWCRTQFSGPTPYQLLAISHCGTGLLDGAGHPDVLVSREPDLSRSTGRQCPKTVTRLEARII